MSIVNVMRAVFLCLTELLVCNAEAQDDIAIVGSSDSRVEIFYARTASNPGIYHSFQTAAGATGQFSAWTRLANSAANPTNIVAHRDSAGRFAAGWIANGAIVVSQGAVNSDAMPAGVKLNLGSLGATPSLESRFRDLVIAEDADGRSELFAISALGHIWSIAQKTAGSWASLNNHDLGGRANVQIAAASYRDGRLAVAALGLGGQISVRSQVGPNDNWGSWTSVPGPAFKRLAALANKDGTLELVAIGSDTKLYQAKQRADWSWPVWSVLAPGQYSSRLALARNADGSLQVFATDVSGSLLNLGQNPDSTWNTHQINNDTSSYNGANGGDNFSVTSLASGVLAFATSQTSLCAAYLNLQKDPGGINWPGPSKIPASLCSPTIAVTKLFANPNQVNAGASAVLGWNYAAAGSCTGITLSLTAGGATLFSQPSGPAFWSYKVTPATTTNYSFTAKCDGTTVSSSKSLTLNVVSPTIPKPYVVFEDGPFFTPSFPATGDPLVGYIVMENVGSASSPAYTVDVSLDDGSGDPPSPIGSFPLGALAKSATGTLNFSLPGQALDQFSLDFMIRETGVGQTYSVTTLP